MSGPLKRLKLGRRQKPSGPPVCCSPAPPGMPAAPFPHPPSSRDPSPLCQPLPHARLWDTVLPGNGWKSERRIRPARVNAARGVTEVHASAKGPVMRGLPCRRGLLLRGNLTAKKHAWLSCPCTQCTALPHPLPAPGYFKFSP